ARGLGGDGDHRPRAGGHGAASGRRRAGRGDLGEIARKAEDEPPGRRGVRADHLGSVADLGGRARLRGCRGDGDLRRRLLLRPAQAAGGRAEEANGREERAGGVKQPYEEQGASSHSRSVMWWRECSPLESSERISASSPDRSANTEWRWMV